MEDRRASDKEWHEVAGECTQAVDSGAASPAAGSADAGGAVAPVSRKVRKTKRRTRMRAKTIAMKRLTKEEIRLGALLYPPEEVERPQTRADCMTGPRPCPFVACKHHLYLDVNPETGSIKLNFPDLEVWEMKETCSLDVADRGGVTLEEVGEILNLTRERIRQVEVRGLLKLKMAAPELSLPPPRNDNDL
ncbi:MAG TPA: sigma factor-like helix-turn-helix DNA-binding protein [Polyangia bacterium]|nr:sigma factor-like helix-turn-helix DNA-binding protein [Polyangia bacterium]